MNSEGFKRKLTAILSADVVGYSRLMRDDEEATVRILNTYKEIIFSLIERNQGRLVDSTGDNLLAEFASVVDTVRCAVQIQEDLKIQNEEFPDNRKMDFRIGINLGDVIHEGDKIYGDGINVAARIESLSDPGGICISRNVYDQVKRKLGLKYEYLGEHQVKNIDDPVRVYNVLMEPGSEEAQKIKRSIEPASVDRMEYPLPDKPSIAILPLWNMSNDSTQEYIGDGISENIIATLSKIGGMFVIASNSTFTYKGKPVKVQQIAEEMGVQYVLEGSVQKSGDRLRVTAQLIDALTGHHLWSEKYDRKMENLFDLQDEITKKIVVSLHVELMRGEESLIAARDTDNLEAWTNSAKGFIFFMRGTKDSIERARKLFKNTVKLDPSYAGAWAAIGATYYLEVMLGYSDSPLDSIKSANEACQKALDINDLHPYAINLQGNLNLIQKQYDDAVAKQKKAIALAPNSHSAYFNLGMTMFFLGRFEESLELIKKAMRLCPYYPAVYLFFLCRSYIFLSRYEEAIESANQLNERCRKGECPPAWPMASLAIVYAELDREEEARNCITEALKLNPNLSLDYIKMIHQFFKDQSHLERILDAYRKAGMPEKAPKAVP